MSNLHKQLAKVTKQLLDAYLRTQDEPTLEIIKTLIDMMGDTQPEVMQPIIQPGMIPTDGVGTEPYPWGKKWGTPTVVMYMAAPVDWVPDSEPSFKVEYTDSTDSNKSDFAYTVITEDDQPKKK